MDEIVTTSVERLSNEIEQAFKAHRSLKALQLYLSAIMVVAMVALVAVTLSVRSVYSIDREVLQVVNTLDRLCESVDINILDSEDRETCQEYTR